MVKFTIGVTDNKPPFVVSLHQESGKISVRLRRGTSECIRVIEFNDGGEVAVHVDRLEKFGLLCKPHVNGSYDLGNTS